MVIGFSEMVATERTYRLGVRNLGLMATLAEVVAHIGLDICYSTTYMSQTRDQQRFTISEVAADWHDWHRH